MLIELNDQTRHDSAAGRCVMPQTRLVPLPKAPQNNSPVPWLTSIHSQTGRGPYGDSSYRGNCGGHLIKDLLHYYSPANVLDPMSGSATCSDVCREVGVPCHSFDLRHGADAADPESYAELETFDFVWMHPPYWRMIRYNEDPRCLSNAATLKEFVAQLRLVLRNCKNMLSPKGHIAVLMGGFSHEGNYMPLAHLTTHAAIHEGLWPACTEIIRFQHGNTSSRRRYNSRFIPGLHDTCMVFRRCEL